MTIIITGERPKGKIGEIEGCARQRNARRREGEDCTSFS